MFFFNLKVVAAMVAAAPTTYVNRIRVRDSSVITVLIYHMPVARGRVKGFQPFPSITHTYTHKKVSKFGKDLLYIYSLV